MSNVRCCKFAVLFDSFKLTNYVNHGNFSYVHVVATIIFYEVRYMELKFARGELRMVTGGATVKSQALICSL